MGNDACDTSLRAKSNALKVSFMAIDPSGGHPAMDYPEHLRTYARFIRWTIATVVFILLVLLFLLTRVP
jgi:hypothetical protein